MTDEEKVLLEQFRHFGLDTTTAEQAISDRDEIEQRHANTRRALVALRPGGKGDFDAESNRLSNLLSGLDLAKQGSDRDVAAALVSLRKEAYEGPRTKMLELSAKIKDCDIEIFDTLLALPDLVQKRASLSVEWQQLVELQKVWTGELGVYASGLEGYGALPGNGLQKDLNTTMRFFIERFLKNVSLPFARPQISDDAETKLTWWLARH
jgi:hypothetical protein